MSTLRYLTAPGGIDETDPEGVGVTGSGVRNFEMLEADSESVPVTSAHAAIRSANPATQATRRREKRSVAAPRCR